MENTLIPSLPTHIYGTGKTLPLITIATILIPVWERRRKLYSRNFRHKQHKATTRRLKTLSWWFRMRSWKVIMSISAIWPDAVRNLLFLLWFYQTMNFCAHVCVCMHACAYLYFL